MVRTNVCIIPFFYFQYSLLIGKTFINHWPDKNRIQGGGIAIAETWCIDISSTDWALTYYNSKLCKQEKDLD